jgi:glycosyltransferase involved in cell wall biosynthesis
VNVVSPAAKLADPVCLRRLSVVIPVKDEIQSMAPLISGIAAAADRMNTTLSEIIVVDDGSTDGTWRELERLSLQERRLRAVRLRRNFGKAAALMIGIGQATGDVIVTMDGDLQDDPDELPRFLQLIERGNDLVSGWKRERHDPASKTLPSRLFNCVTASVTGVPLHDFNCGYKAYRREVFDAVQVYGEMHRYIPVLAHALGFRIAELPVRHHPRQFGASKYGMRRLLRGFVDLLSVMMITRYAHSPGHLAALKTFAGAEIGGRPLLMLGVLLAVIGVQFLLFGMLAELIISRSPRPQKLETLIAEVTSSGEGLT